ncbi:palmitoyltransferase ZDHHC15 isoform 1-T1 [Spheniscus humboldti]
MNFLRVPEHYCNILFSPMASRGLGCCARADCFTFWDLVLCSHIKRFKPSNEDTISAVRNWMLTLYNLLMEKVVTPENNECQRKKTSVCFSWGFCKVTLSNPVEKVAYLIIFHILFVLFVWTYWKSIFTLPVQPGKKYHMSYADKERYENEERPEVQRQILAEIARKLPVYTRTGNGGVRFCDRCQLIKPDRCHHCSVCAICVLKMDHHCPWVNNCIGFSNYKFFLLFLAYSLLYCLYIAATVFKYFIKYWTGELTNGRSKFHVLFLLFVAVMFFVSLMFLFGYHCWLVSRNRSTLEAFSAPVFQNGPDKNGFNLGFVKNLQQVFGEEKKLWLLPIASSQGDGHFFPMRALCEAQNPLLANEEQWEDDGIDEEPHDSGEASSLAIERET